MRVWYCVLFEEKTECERIQMCVGIGGGWGVGGGRVKNGGVRGGWWWKDEKGREKRKEG